jgi:hypothetical protein
MNKPKVICLMPVKNEADVLPITLNVISKYCDTVIIADQMSADGSREIYKMFPNIRVIDNPRNGHSNQVRWDLLKTARQYGDNNLIISLDADEYIPPKLFEKFLNETDFKAGDSFRFPWIQLWKSTDYFNDTGVWYRNYQRAAWLDDGVTNYGEEIIINDHVARVPPAFLDNCKKIDSLPIIHLQWLSWNKTQFKQILYRCTELVKKPNDYISINSAYSHSLDCDISKLSKVKPEWIDDIDSLKTAENLKPTWHLQEIKKLFDEHGILFFEPLQIWHIKELEDEFIKQTGRKPVSIQENSIIKNIKKIKRYLIKLIHY